jgi:DNA invertase Pin-like site-specific DNA recombinase
LYNRAMTKPVAALYVRVSSDQQVETGASLDAQQFTLLAEAEKRGYEPIVFREEGKSAKNLNRPELQKALAMLDKGKASILMSVRLDRVSRSVPDFASLMARAQKKQWRIVLLESNIDMTEASGEFVANVLASAAQYERRLIAVRTREGMAQKKAEGVIFGRVVAEDHLPVYQRVLALHGAGKGLSEIARTLNEEHVPTARGGAQWHPAPVRRIVMSQTAKRLVQA